MTSEEDQAIFIGERLGIFQPCEMASIIPGHLTTWIEYKNDVDGGYYALEYAMKWLSSLEGIRAIKQKMIERGYSMYIDYNSDSKEWCCDFFFPKKHQGKHGATEAEAVLAATEKALRREG
jgi:hypothetical protein